MRQLTDIELGYYTSHKDELVRAYSEAVMERGVNTYGYDMYRMTYDTYLVAVSMARNSVASAHNSSMTQVTVKIIDSAPAKLITARLAAYILINVMPLIISHDALAEYELGKEV